jgi:hypothetical protein
MQGPVTGVGLLLAARSGPDDALGIAVEVLEERLTDVARHQRGLSYSVTREVLDTAPGAREVAVVVDAREGQEAAVAGVLWDQYLELCDRGPSAAEIAHAVEGFAEHLDSGDDVVGRQLADAAFAEVFGLPWRSADEALDARRAVTPATAAAALRATAPTAVLVVPEGVEPALDGIERRFLCDVVPELPAGATYRPPLLARVRSREARLRLVVTDEGLAHGDSDGDGHLIPWSEVAAAVPASQGAGVLVVGRNLCGIDVHEDRYGRRAVEAVRARLPERAWVPAPRRSPEDTRG